MIIIILIIIIIIIIIDAAGDGGGDWQPKKWLQHRLARVDPRNVGASRA
jgi:hypothetical protein